MVADTIFAPATGSGKAGVAIIRMSGPRAGDGLLRLAALASPAPRFAHRCVFVDPSTGEALDDGLALWFPAPASFTGEDVAELHVHGGRATVQAVCECLSEMEGCRLAGPGEFTRRAFDNGKLDLTKVEGLADLIAAETESQRKQALRQLSGSLGAILEDWRQSLLHTLALIEADIDFPEEGLPDHLASQARHKILGLAEEMIAYLDDERRGERIREGVLVAILGAPNVGKSSLMNALSHRDVAIVTDTPGTTRDVLEVQLDLGGYAVTLLDTAGLRDTPDPIEQQGVKRARERAEEADIRLIVLDARAGQIDPESRALLEKESIVVANKIDAAGDSSFVGELDDFSVIPISALYETNLDALIEELTRRVALLADSQSGVPLTRARHREALRECVAALERAAQAAEAELIAEDVRLAARSLGRLTGRVDVEDVLDVIFREFCIGK